MDFFKYKKQKAKLIALFSLLDHTFVKKVKEGSFMKKYINIYKKEFKSILKNKNIKFYSDASFVSNDIYEINDGIVYDYNNNKPMLTINRINELESDLCLFCMNKFDDLRKHYEEEINNIK